MEDTSTKQSAAMAKAEASKLVAASVTEVTDGSELSAAKAHLLEINRLKKSIDDKRKEITRPHRLVISQTDALFDAPLQTLKDGRKRLEEVIKAYRNK